MGFGTLFFGYFLLLNIAYYSFTDAIAALVMLYAFYKLKFINKNFKYAAISAAVFSAFGLYELFLGFSDMFFGLSYPDTLYSVSAMVRSLIICIVSAFMLMGIRDVSAEVGLSKTKIKANYLSYVTVGVYALNVVLEMSELGSWLAPTLLATLMLVSFVATPVLVIVNLTVLFSCYVKICMPNEEQRREVEKKSKLEFVNKFREHQKEKQREYAEYKIEKMKKKANKPKQNYKDKK